MATLQIRYLWNLFKWLICLSSKWT